MPWKPGPRARWILQCVAALSILCDNALLVQPSARSSALATWRASPTPFLPSGHLRKLRGGSGSSQSMNDEACVLMAMGGEDNLRRAEAALRAALDENPANAAALCNYGRLLQRQDRDLELAGDMLAKAVRLRPEAAIFSSYALFLEDGVRDMVRARELYERALLLHPADPVLLHNFAELLRCHAGVGAAAQRGGEGRDNASPRQQERPGHARRTAQQEWDLGLARSLYAAAQWSRDATAGHGRHERSALGSRTGFTCAPQRRGDVLQPGNARVLPAQPARGSAGAIPAGAGHKPRA
jgi:hypothetical protein